MSEIKKPSNNKWINFVKSKMKRTGKSYNCVLCDPQTRLQYHKKYNKDKIEKQIQKERKNSYSNLQLLNKNPKKKQISLYQIKEFL